MAYSIDLSGRVAFVTGASGGLGAQFARTLAGAGAAVVLSPMAAAGRMAFTNYLTQSLIMTCIFYGGRGALMGQVDRPALWGIVLAIWALQLTWSPLWLKRFEMGPFEWIWRCLTMGRLLPIRKGPAGAAAA